MIEFDCPHCGNHLSHQETFAGRDGWCRICKGIISIPQPGQPAPVLNLSLEQRYGKLERLFKHAVSIVDEYRQLQARLQNGGDGLVEELQLRTEAERAANAFRVQAEEASALHQSAQEECDQLRGRVDQLETDSDGLREQLDAEVLNRSTVEVTLEEMKPIADRVPALEGDLSDAQAEVDRREHENDELLERVLEAEQKLDAAEAMATHVESERSAERDTNEERLDGLRGELCAAEEGGAELQAQLDTVASRNAQLQTELDDANTALSVERDRLNEEVERLKTLHEAEVSLRTEAEKQVAEAMPLAESVPGLESDLSDARTKISEDEERHRVLVLQVADTERALELSGKRASDARAAWESQRQQLMNEMDVFRSAQRAAEEETASARARGREVATELQALLDDMQADLVNETRLRVTSEESEQRLQRSVADANAERDDALSRRDQVSRRLETALEDVESARADISKIRSSIAESEASEQALHARLKEACTERDSAIGSRDQLASTLDETTGSLESAQRVSHQLRSRISELDQTVAALKDGNASAAAEEADDRVEVLNTHMNHLTEKVADLENALAASNREKTRLEQRLVGAENRAAYSELEGIGYRSKFSSMAKQFFEQEVARQTETHDLPETDTAPLDESGSDTLGNADVLDAVTRLRL